MFTTTDIREGRTVCIYTGVLRKSVSGNNSLYLLEVECENTETGVVEQWFLDSTDYLNSSGRYINDACDYEGCPAELQTGYTTNTRFTVRVSRHPHPVIGVYYVRVISLYDLPKYTELFVRYGVSYWKKCIHYYKNQDPNILVGDAYDKYTKQYEK